MQPLVQFNETYNSLPSVEIANDTLDSHNKESILKSLSEVIVAHDLQDIIGIRLLHNHNQISENEVMVENEELDEKENNCLVTFAKHNSDLNEYFPNSWKFQLGEFHPLEYSNDKMVTSSASILNNKRRFFTDFKIRLEELDVAEILGPCIICREFYQKYQPLTPFVLAETSDEKRRANIVQFEQKGKYSDESLILTTWMAIKNEHSNNPELVCKVACISISACVKDDKGNHSRQTRHNQGSHINS